MSKEQAKVGLVLAFAACYIAETTFDALNFEFRDRWLKSSKEMEFQRTGHDKKKRCFSTKWDCEVSVAEHLPILVYNNLNKLQFTPA